MSPRELIAFVRLVIGGDAARVSQLLAERPELATLALPVGATKATSPDTFFAEIRHYMYGGDTALHMAAAAFSRPVAVLLIANRAICCARNRRGAEPLHYAADGRGERSQEQAAVIEYLVSVGADPNALDKSGVAPLHRAVRTRATEAVRALLDAGANPRQTNGSGSSPLHLAVQMTGATNSGSEDARRQQEHIIRLLVQRGARLSDKDAKAKTVAQAATSRWLRELLAGYASSGM